MTQISLNNDLFLAIENDAKRARLVVYKNGVENVCRKETFNKLQKFMLSDGEHLFKGRLQLYKENSNIIVKIKGGEAGRITVNEFADYLQKVKNNLIKVS